MKIMYHNLHGLQLVEPGYRKSRIAPLMIVGIPSMEGCIETVYGRPGCIIFCLKGTYCEDISIPANTSAIIALPEREETEPGRRGDDSEICQRPAGKPNV